MKEFCLELDISKDFEVNFNIELDSSKIKQEEERKELNKNVLQVRKQLLTIDGKLEDA